MGETSYTLQNLIKLLSYTLQNLIKLLYHPPKKFENPNNDINVNPYVFWIEQFSKDDMGCTEVWPILI